jgi:ankyrin repeat protein
MTKQDEFKKAVINNDISLVEILLKDKDIDPAYDNNSAMRIVSREGHFDIAKLLIADGRVEFTNYPYCHSVLEALSFKGHFNIVELLLNETDTNPSDYNNIALTNAANYGHLKIVQLLLKDKRVNPADCQNLAIRNATYNGHKEITELLLSYKRVDPSDFENHAIYFSYENGLLDIVSLLWNDNRVKTTLVNDFSNLYAILMQKDIQCKMSKF